jgi:addiction module RelE/StbE family toxin
VKIELTPEFVSDYRQLASSLQGRVDNALRRLTDDPHYPGLRVKKMKGYRGIWEARVSKGYRLTFQIKNDCMILRRVGPHSIEDSP